MGYSLTNAQANQILQALRKDYRVYAPRRFPKQGRYSGTDIVRYGEVKHIEDIVWEVKSDYPAKEVINPIQQTLFFFTEDEFRSSSGPTKPALIFARPCDINAQQIQATIYCKNGGFDDMYYSRNLEGMKFVLMDCNGGDDTCFCVSMHANTTDNYAIAVKFTEDGVRATVRDKDMDRYFDGMPEAEYTPEFVQENELKVTPPDIPNKEVLKALKKHPMWKEYDSRCISCGACTIACPTCTCYTARDIAYGDNPEVGERRRVSASCEIAGFDQMAAQGEIRNTPADRMRYKVLHKFYDYKERFGERNMCIGCGRCTRRCPELITITATVRKMNDALAEIKNPGAPEAGAGS